MITSLDKALSRKLTVPGIAGELVVTIGPEGVSFRLKGSQREITAPWAAVIAACATPISVPTFLIDEPFAFLQHIANQIAQRATKLPPKKPAQSVRSQRRVVMVKQRDGSWIRKSGRGA
jgi:hypothetical protein